RTAWGYRGVGEPGVIYDEDGKTFYLYYTSMRFSPKEPSIGHIGILLATSKDGSRFTRVTDESGQSKLILTRDIPNATKGAWFGYSSCGRRSRPESCRRSRRSASSPRCRSRGGSSIGSRISS